MARHTGVRIPPPEEGAANGFDWDSGTVISAVWSWFSALLQTRKRNDIHVSS